jgi:hypothetical protein
MAGSRPRRLQASRMRWLTEKPVSNKTNGRCCRLARSILPLHLPRAEAAPPRGDSRMISGHSKSSDAGRRATARATSPESTWAFQTLRRVRPTEYQSLRFSKKPERSHGDAASLRAKRSAVSNYAKDKSRLRLDRCNKSLQILEIAWKFILTAQWE